MIMHHTLMEIRNQPVSWLKTLHEASRQWEIIEKSLNVAPSTYFVFIGSGTSFYLAHSAARMFQEVTGNPSVAVPSSEVFLATQATIPTNIPVVAFAISRSGTTSEVLMAVEYLQKNCPNSTVVGITCHSDKTLAKLAAHAIVLDHAAEQSVVMTQSFTNMLLALQVVAAKMAGRDDLISELANLPELLGSSLESAESFGRTWGESSGYKQYVFLGLGAYYGLAAEATLKLKEMTQTTCEYYNPMEFRHGPISIITEGTAVLSMAGRGDASYVEGVLRDIQKLGGTTVALVPQHVPFAAEHKLFLPGDLSDWSRAVLYMPAFHYLAYYRAVSLGLNPDAPRNLTQVVII
jgi:glucosamine--fructose-6-phosphate aminotransferase (isomerizing)